MSELLDDDAITSALAGLPGWRRDGASLTASVTSADFDGAMTLVNRIAEIARSADHHPDIDIRWATVRLACSSHSDGGITDRDVSLAGEISAAAGALGLTLD